MICDLCKQDVATSVMKQVVDGVVKELHICKACAAKHGLQSPLSITDFLFGASAAAAAADKPKRQSCPRCHMTISDFQKTNRLGCGACYETFEAELVPIIDGMHRAQQHVGRRPASETLRAEVAAVRARLTDAVRRQAFEEAAGLRDQILTLETRLPEGGHGR